MVERIVRNDIDGDGAEPVVEVDATGRFEGGAHAAHELGCLLLDDLLEVKDLLAREEGVQSGALDAVHVRARRGEGRLFGAEGAVEGRVLAVSRADVVDLVAVLRVAEVDFIRGDADDRACGRRD